MTTQLQLRLELSRDKTHPCWMESFGKISHRAWLPAKSDTTALIYCERCGMQLGRDKKEIVCK
jgi:hypothetical protein